MKQKKIMRQKNNNNNENKSCDLFSLFFKC